MDEKLKIPDGFCVLFFLQERRREFEANLEKAGLELETEDKSVRFWDTHAPHCCTFIMHLLFHSIFLSKA